MVVNKLLTTTHGIANKSFSGFQGSSYILNLVHLDKLINPQSLTSNTIKHYAFFPMHFRVYKVINRY